MNIIGLINITGDPFCCQEAEEARGEGREGERWQKRWHGVVPATVLGAADASWLLVPPSVVQERRRQRPHFRPPRVLLQDKMGHRMANAGGLFGGFHSHGRRWWREDYCQRSSLVPSHLPAHLAPDMSRWRCLAVQYVHLYLLIPSNIQHKQK